MYRTVFLTPVLMMLALGLMSEIAFAQSSTLASKLDSTGTIAANRKVALSAKITGRIEEIGFEEGDRVKKGQALAIMNAVELEADLAAAKAALGLATVELEHAQKTEARVERLFKKKSVSEDALDDARYKTRAARERVRSAKADVARADAILSEARLIAPFDAVVTEKHAEVGQLTRPGETLFVLEDHGVLKFRTHVKERDIRFIELGQSVVVIIDALDDARLNGKVTKIIPSGDENHTFVVEATLPATNKLYPGMFGKAEFSR
jgi:RND family efflux transporter MFP subunit